MRVFCDLEETLITNWHDAILTNVSRVSGWITEHNVTEIEIFSFACWNEADRDYFNTTMKEMIERAFKIKVTRVWTVEEIRRIVLLHLCAQFDVREFISVWGKKRAFIEFCDATFKDEVCVLLDDCVPNITTINHDKNLKVECVKVAWQKPLRSLKE